MGCSLSMRQAVPSRLAGAAQFTMPAHCPICGSAAVREEGEVTEQVLRQAFIGEVGRMVRQVSSVAGMRQIVSFPFAYLMGFKRK